MSQTAVGDLVVNLDVDAAKFREEVAYVKKQFDGVSDGAKKATDQVVASFTKQEAIAKRAGLSVGQYNNAMRMLPAQMSDVAVQLAGGQNPFLILLQQGSQIKDSFGGLKPTFTALTGSLSPLMLGFGALAAVAGGLLFSIYKGSEVFSELNNALVLSGNSAGLTTDRMLSIAVAGERANLSFTQVSKALVALVNAGVSAHANFDQLSVSVAEFSKASGEKVEKVAEAFAKLTSDPTAGLIAMSQQFHNVTAEQISFVAQLQRAGDFSRALTTANEVATRGFDAQTKSIENNMGTLKSWAHDVGEAFSSMWDKMLDIGRPDTGSEILKKAQTDYDVARKNYEGVMNQRGASDDLKAQYKRMLDRSSMALSMAQQEADIQALAAQGAKKNAEDEQDRLKYAKQAQDNYGKSQTALEKYTARQKELNGALKNGKILQNDYNINMAAAKKEYEDALKKPKATTTPSGIKAEDSTSARTLELRTQLQVLQQHQGLNDKISTQRQELWRQEATFTVLERAATTRTLTANEKSLLASKDTVLEHAKINAELGDQIVAQQRLNDLQDTAQKYVTQMSEKTKAMAESVGLSSRASQRNLDEAQLRQGWLNKGGNTDDQGYKTELNALKGYYAAQDQLRSDWQAGASTSLANFADEASNYNRIAADSTTSILNGTTSTLSTAITRILTDTKNAGAAVKEMFAGMGQVVIQTLANMAAQWLVYQAVQLVVGKTTRVTASSGLIANAQASALMAQLNAYASTAAIPIVGPAMAPVAMATAAGVTMPLVAAITASSLAGMAHDGLDRVPETGTWLLQQGERVTTAKTSAKLDRTLDDVRTKRDSSSRQISYSPQFHTTGVPDAGTLAMMQDMADQAGRVFYARVVNETAGGNGRMGTAMRSYRGGRKIN